MVTPRKSDLLVSGLTVTLVLTWVPDLVQVFLQRKIQSKPPGIAMSVNLCSLNDLLYACSWLGRSLQLGTDLQTTEAAIA